MTPPAGFDPAAGWNVWFARRPPDGDEMVLAAVASDAHRNRAVVDGVGDDALPGPGGTLLYHAWYAPSGLMRRVVVPAAVAPGAPDLWYLEVPEPAADPPATNLLAFATPEVPDGTLLDDDAFVRLGADPREQVAAVRWWTRTGQVHQVYVSPHWRRRRVGTKLVLAGAASTVGRRWPSLWSTGDLTDLGHAWIRASIWRTRVAPRASVVAPMTPAEEGVGVPGRQLRPDGPVGD